MTRCDLTAANHRFATLALATSVTRCWNKKSPIFFKVAQKLATAAKLKKSWFSKLCKKSTSIRATFERKFVPKNFQKSPNLVTLQVRFASLELAHNKPSFAFSKTAKKSRIKLRMADQK